jgi:hypothetical protein
LESIENAPYAATCAGEVMQRLTTSPEQFYAAQLHMYMCEKWKNEDDSAGKSYSFCYVPYGRFHLNIFWIGGAADNRSVKVFQRVQTEESLRYFKLENTKYAALTQYPERLIRLLFEDCVPDQFQAINSAAENICEIYGINLKVLKRSLIQEWLPPIESYVQEEYYNEHLGDIGGFNGSSK